MAKRFSRFLSRLVVGHPVAIVVFYSLLAALSAWLVAYELRLKTEQNELVGSDQEYNRRYLRFLREFGDLEFIYVVFQVGDDPEEAVAAVESLGSELRRLEERSEGSPLIRSFFHRVPPSALRHGIPLLDVEQLEKLSGWLEDHRRELAGLAGSGSFSELLDVFARALRPESLMGDAGDGYGPAVERPDEEVRRRAEWGFRLLELTLSSMARALRGGEPEALESALERQLELSPLERGYLATRNGRLLVVEVTPALNTDEVEIIREPLVAIRAAVDRVRDKHPGVEMGITGRPVLQADEMRTASEDTRFATCVALAGVLCLFVLFFRRLKRPCLSALTLGLSILLTLGVVTVTIGYLTLLSVVFTAMLVGLGIDFGIHFVARYQDELRATGDVGRAIQNTLETTGRSIATGAVTTAAAFFMLLFVDFQGLRELGFIAGTGVLICFLSMVTFLPALMLLFDQRSVRHGRVPQARPVRVPFLDRLARRPRCTLACAGVVSLVGLLGLKGLPYSSNLLELQAEKLESVQYEKLVIKESDFSTWFCAFVVDSLDGVREILAQLDAPKEAGIVGATESVLDYLPPGSGAEGAERRRELQDVAWSVVRGVEFGEPSSRVDVGALGESLDELLDSLDDLESLAIQRGEADAVRELHGLAVTVEGLTESIASATDTQRQSLASFQVGWFSELHGLLGELRASVEPRGFGLDDLPHALRRRLVSSDASHYLVYANPRRDIWDDRNMEEFVAAMRRIDPDVTGAPVQVYESSRLMHEGFILSTLLALVVTFVFLLVDLRSLRFALVAMAPLLLGLLWLLEALPVVGLRFNLANFFALPILIGCGIDGGVHIVHRFREARSVEAVLRTTCSAVTLSFLTTMVGFGAMAFASHRGVQSLGLMMVTGLACVLVASVVVLPALLSLWGGGTRSAGHPDAATERAEGEELEEVTVGESG